jgi:DNA-binding transcriptional ArsR family regulator
MSGIFPLRQTVDTDDRREPRLVDLDDDVADEVFQALSSGTTRRIFTELHESPQAASDLAEVTDTSVQNVQYHLEKLVEADLVEVVDTWYSERGTEMKVYAPTDESLVLFAGRDKGSSLRTLLKRLAGGIALLLPASALVGLAARQYLSSGYQVRTGEGESGGDGALGAQSGGADGANITAAGQATPTGTEADMGDQAVADSLTPTPKPEGTPVPEGMDAMADGGRELIANTGADPAMVGGLAFFLGGLFVLTIVLGVWYWRT